MMNGYEKIVTMMKQAGRKSMGSPVIAIGEMIDSKNCKIDELTLDTDDYMIAERLKDKLKAGDMVIVLRYSEEIYIIIEKVVEA